MVGTLVKQIKTYKMHSILTIVFTIGEVILELLIPLLMASVIDQGIEAGNMQSVLLYGGLMILSAVAGLLCGVLGGRSAAIASSGFACNLRDAMYENIQTFSFSNIDKYSTASLVTRLTTDVTNLQNAYQMILRMCVRAPISLISAMVMAMLINVRVSLVFLVAIVLLGGVLALIMSRTMPLFRSVFAKYDELNNSVQENVTAIRVVKAYVREDYERSKFEKAAENIYRLFVKAEGTLAFNNPAMMFTVYGCILAISWLGAKMIVIGSLTTGELTSLYSYVMSIMMSLMLLSIVFVMISISYASAQRIAEVINEKSDITEKEQPVQKVENGDVSFEHVDFTYQTDGEGELVLSDINMEVKSGQIIGIVGATGSAKSSLVSLISRLYDVTNGSVKVGGKDVRDYDLEVLRDQVAVVLQKNQLFSGTILDNLRWGNENASYEECVHACELAQADEFIKNFPDQYDTYIEQGGTNVSGGQKQRLCIARALMKHPKVLILDDSTSAVDTTTDRKIRESFKYEIPGTTQFIIAQRISSVQHADKILVLESGKINGFGSHEELLKSNEIYASMYESQTSGGGDFDE